MYSYAIAKFNLHTLFSLME